MNKEILNLLFCPDSKLKLDFKENELFSPSTSYPVFNGIPWLFKNPEFHFLQWGTKIENFIKEEATYIKYLQNMTNLHENKLTRKRLTKILEAKSKNLKYIEKTLEVFRGHQQIALSASTQQIHSYFQLIFRDWSWESDENKHYLEYAKACITDETKNVLVLGSGASNLSYELAKANPNSNFISLDHNPLLLFTSQKIFNAEEVKLADYTNYPKDIESTAKNYKIKREKTDLANHQFILGSFPNLPFANESFDLIIAPWFFDILDFEYEQSIKYCLSYLKPNGNFCLFGPNNIHKHFMLDQLSSDEVNEILSQLFVKSSFEYKDLNYLNNPLNSQNRIERVMFFSGEKKKITEADIVKEPQKPNLVKFDPSFEHHKAVNATFYHIFKHIEDDITIEDLAKKLETEFGFKPDEAIFYADNFINKILMDLNKS